MRTDRPAGRDAGLLASALALALAACGGGDNPGPDEVTVGEARALDEAGEMLRERRQSDESPRLPRSQEETIPRTTEGG